MDSLEYSDSSSVSYLNSNHGIEFDGRSYALYDPNFKIYDSFTINFQLQTFGADGLLLWIHDPLPDSSFTIEIQNRQLIARAVARGQPYSVRTNFSKNRLCDGIWHFVQIRLDGSSLSMKVDKRQYTKTEARVRSLDLHGPLFIAGHSEKYTPTYLSVRTKQFFHGNVRNLKINDKQIDWLAPRRTVATPDYYHLTSAILSTVNDQLDFDPTTIVKRTPKTISSSLK
ncbi:unnamed protein product [Adineta steineri]|uniref:Laminin G domain-containing protein n=2 Tax=Adineta steineri TaxID=433720 RepID=A0A819EPY1_9BILA|nr:unnamed protein product [Adineta steineri]CAF1258464.1 unnamed protein product [Adineta steineri]CAF1360414.1 unnamed protein product [Adineta steineri]CAF3709556.1 unnamed protein product [Adineta steineri]CAF3854532.1 unnamed protein product [Adineta steineri]